MIFVLAEFNEMIRVSSDEIKERIPRHVLIRPKMFSFREGGSKNAGQTGHFVIAMETDKNGTISAVLLYIRREAGWPMSSFDGEIFMTANGLEESYTFHVPESLFDSAKYYFLPLRPIWYGFVLNTALYGSAAWLLICGPFVLRRSRRRRHGKCVACGYPIGMSEVCTECGFALIRVASNAAK